MNMKTMDYNIGDKLNGNTTPIGNMNIDSSAINGLETVHDQLLLELNRHVLLEHNPERLLLNDSMAEGAWSGVNRVIIPGVRDDIEAAVTAPNGITAETNTAISETLPIEVPARVAAPAVVDGISSRT